MWLVIILVFNSWLASSYRLDHLSYSHSCRPFYFYNKIVCSYLANLKSKAREKLDIEQKIIFNIINLS